MSLRVRPRARIMKQTTICFPVELSLKEISHGCVLVRPRECAKDARNYVQQECVIHFNGITLDSG